MAKVLDIGNKLGMIFQCDKCKSSSKKLKIFSCNHLICSFCFSKLKRSEKGVCPKCCQFDNSSINADSPLLMEIMSKIIELKDAMELDLTLMSKDPSINLKTIYKDESHKDLDNYSESSLIKSSAEHDSDKINEVRNNVDDNINNINKRIDNNDSISVTNSVEPNQYADINNGITNIDKVILTENKITEVASIEEEIYVNKASYITSNNIQIDKNVKIGKPFKPQRLNFKKIDTKNLKNYTKTYNQNKTGIHVSNANKPYYRPLPVIILRHESVAKNSVASRFVRRKPLIRDVTNENIPRRSNFEKDIYSFPGSQLIEKSKKNQKKIVLRNNKVKTNLELKLNNNLTNNVILDKSKLEVDVGLNTSDLVVNKVDLSTDNILNKSDRKLSKKFKNTNKLTKINEPKSTDNCLSNNNKLFQCENEIITVKLNSNVEELHLVSLDSDLIRLDKNLDSNNDKNSTVDVIANQMDCDLVLENEIFEIPNSLNEEESVVLRVNEIDDPLCTKTFEINYKNIQTANDSSIVDVKEIGEAVSSEGLRSRKSSSVYSVEVLTSQQMIELETDVANMEAEIAKIEQELSANNSIILDNNRSVENNSILTDSQKNLNNSMNTESMFKSNNLRAANDSVLTNQNNDSSNLNSQNKTLQHNSDFNVSKDRHDIGTFKLDEDKTVNRLNESGNFSQRHKQLNLLQVTITDVKLSESIKSADNNCMNAISTNYDVKIKSLPLVKTNNYSNQKIIQSEDDNLKIETELVGRHIISDINKKGDFTDTLVVEDIMHYAMNEFDDDSIKNTESDQLYLNEEYYLGSALKLPITSGDTSISNDDLGRFNQEKKMFEEELVSFCDDTYGLDVDSKYVTKKEKELIF